MEANTMELSWASGDARRWLTAARGGAGTPARLREALGCAIQRAKEREKRGVITCGLPSDEAALRRGCGSRGGGAAAERLRRRSGPEAKLWRCGFGEARRGGEDGAALGAL